MRFGAVLLVQALFCVVSWVAAQEQNEVQYSDAIVPEGTAIEKLTLANFAKFIKENELVLGEFTVPWCLHSKILLPELVKAAERLDADKGIKVFQVDCSVDGPLCDQIGIAHYPSLKTFKNHKMMKDNEYTGRRTANDIYDFMVNHVASPVKRVQDVAQLHEMYLAPDKMENPAVVYYGAEPQFDEIFGKAANELLNSFSFVSCAQCASENEDLRDKVVLYMPPVDERELELNNHTVRPETSVFELTDLASVDLEELRSWLMYSRLPYFDNANIENYRLYMESKLPLAYFFYVSPQEYMDYKEFFGELGRKYRGNMNFLGLNALVFHSHVRFLNMKEQFPLFAIHDLPVNQKYGLPQLTDDEYKSLTDLIQLDRGEITQLVDDFLAGTAVPLVKSQPIPETQENVNVTRVVGMNHDEMVHDATMDVVVRYFADWDAQSRKLEPAFNEVAAMFAMDPEANVKVRFVDVDAAENDILSFPVTSFPTIAVYPAGSQGPPLVHQGVVAKNSLMLFIRDAGAHHIDGFELMKKYNLTEDIDSDSAVDDVVANKDAEVREENAHDEL